jgi:L-malate glycosyltransferase
VTELSVDTEKDDRIVREDRARTAVFLMTNTLESGGTERQFVTLANALERDRFSLSLGCIKRTGPFMSEVDGLNEFFPGGNLFGVQSWRARLSLARFLRGKQIQVAHSFDFYSNLMLIPAGRFAGVPAVIGSHRQLGDLLTAAKFRAQNAAFRFCRRVVCNSRAAAGRLRAAGVPDRKLVVIPNGLPDVALAETPPALPVDPWVLRIGMISRMNDPIKNHDLFLRAAARLAPQFLQIRFVLVGDGPQRPGLEKLAQELSLGERVVFLGDRRDVPAILAALDVSVLPSSSESLSNVILESMAAGVAVVAANVGGNPELIEDGETGFLFPNGDEGKFAAALEKLVKQPDLRKQLGRNARERARLRYSIRTVRQQYQDLYDELLSEKVLTLSAAGGRLAAGKSRPEEVSR